ncbi:aldo-keto reductase family 1 member B1-like [Saccoglossus kowalevskii]|uniref:Aldose reductase-like n=1 Tax=Saccoglossus kowalevskii TaxID=10224 RepID=A0ABM0MKQ8_SACKO|nr:PREDICTED: aldose reductase-like [Saccoglossus kowalevskii]
MEKLVDDGLVSSIGVSNFNHAQLERILNMAKYKPVNNQIEVHPYNAQTELIAWCYARNITVTCHTALGRPGLVKGEPNMLEEPIVKAIAAKHKKSPAQILLKFCVDRGCAVIPKSINPKRMKENIEISDFKITLEDIRSMEQLNRNWRHSQDSFWSCFRNHVHYPFNDF